MAACRYTSRLHATPETQADNCQLLSRGIMDHKSSLPARAKTVLREPTRSNVDEACLCGRAVCVADTARSLLIRAEDAEVSPGAEAWSAWLCGAAGAGDVELEAHSWTGLAASLKNSPKCFWRAGSCPEDTLAWDVFLARAAGGGDADQN